MPQVTLEQAMRIALGHHQAGRLGEAEAIYRQALDHDPDYPPALHLLGVLACQTGQLSAAIDLIGRAIARLPDVAEYHSNLGEAYRLSGQYAAAIASLERAIALKPGLAEAHNHLGLALHDSGRRDEAAAAYRQAIAARPDLAEAHNNLAIVLSEQGRRDEAIAAYERATAVRPDYAAAHNNLGNALWDAGQRDRGLQSYHRAIALKPDFAEAHNNLGYALHQIGRGGEAIATLRRAIALKPDFAEAHNNLGKALCEAGRVDEAIAACRRAIELAPRDPKPYCNLGNALWERLQCDKAIDTYQHALELDPDHAPTLNNLGNAYKEVGRLDDALDCLRRAARVKPDFVEPASNALLTLHYHPGYDAAAILEEHRRWARQYAEPLAGEIRPHENDRSPERRLKVGYVSPDFRNHPVGHAFLPLLAHHDRSRFEVIGYCDVRVPDRITERMRALVDQWQTIVHLDDAHLAERIRADRIDILVDLALHTAHNRMLVFARKPAPVQVTAFGMPATTGLATIDYRLTDPYLDPPGAGDELYSERSIRLPHSFWCYAEAEEAPPVGGLPALGNGFVTFGCLNQFSKMSRGALELWVRILQAAPSSRLTLSAPPGRHLEGVRALFRAGSVADQRLEVVAKTSRRRYFERFLGIDVGLDPFPYNGHTSTLDAVWMGVPVVTLAGRTAVGRGGVSLLSNVGMPELIACTGEEYVEIALGLARDLPALAELRARLRQQLRSSPLMDGPAYAAAVEAAFRTMWRQWCGS
jgi:predicted O-linked N-acetylglucosamine transferase (SPINDLY family)